MLVFPLIIVLFDFVCLHPFCFVSLILMSHSFCFVRLPLFLSGQKDRDCDVRYIFFQILRSLMKACIHMATPSVISHPYDTMKHLWLSMRELTRIKL